VQIAFNQAIPIAAVGLGVNLLSAFLLHDNHEHQHGHGHTHGQEPDHEHAHDHSHEETRSEYNQDHNLRAAFVHVMADAAVSVLVIIGLIAGRQFGWIWMDPLMGLVATVVILSWSWTLIRSAGAILIDACPDSRLSRRVAARLEQEGDRVSDLHLWRLGPGHLAAVISLVTDIPHPPSFYKKRLLDVPGLSHVTIEVEQCPGAHGHH
jgi:cation diffusion facilitator family transporter